MENKHVLVTGGSKGLGLSIVKVLLNDGYHVHVINRSKTAELTQLEEIFLGKIHVYLYDLSNVEELSSFLKNNIKNSIPIHAFINNAAMAYDDIVTNLNAERLQNMYAINVFSPMMMTKYVLRNMLLHKTAGSIVHLSSISVHTGYKGLSMYASTKGALEAFSKNTAREWGERGIRSNCIVAGFMETEMSSTLSDDQRNRIYNRTSLKKPTSKESVAETICFLISDAAASITGQNIFVDNGTI
jgi:3-oxoacyl-[acyl-carrier protein] reductase